MPSLRTILHPTDFSKNSRSAFQTACSWARDQNANLILFHVIPPPAGPILAQSAPDPLKAAESQEALKSWHFAWPQPHDVKVRVEHRVAEGDAPREILRLAEAVHCDLIVMGTHGRAGLGRLLAGSVAEEVLRKASCPVMVVKESEGQSAADEEPPAQTGEVVDAGPLGTALTSARTQTLVCGEHVEVVRLIVPAGKEIKEPKTRGETVVQCLEGQVVIIARGKTQNLNAGKLLALPSGEPYTVEGTKNASLLVTMLRPGP